MSKKLLLTLDENSHDAIRFIRLRNELKDESAVISLALKVLYNLQLQAERGYTKVCAKKPESDDYIVFTTLSLAPAERGEE